MHFYSDILTLTNAPAVGISYHSLGVIGPYNFADKGKGWMKIIFKADVQFQF